MCLYSQVVCFEQRRNNVIGHALPCPVALVLRLQLFLLVKAATSRTIPIPCNIPKFNKVQVDKYWPISIGCEKICNRI